MKNNFVKVESDASLVRDMSSDAIINRNKSEFDKFNNLSKIKYKEKQEFNQVKTDLSEVKQELKELKELLKSIVQNWIINISR